MPQLTTITPYWKRPEMLRVWLRALRGASIPEVTHLIYFVGERAPDWAREEVEGNTAFHFQELPLHTPGHYSIGCYHNMGAVDASSEWMMKLDLDALPNVRYFRELLPLLSTAEPKQWFNGGMIYMSRLACLRYLALSSMPVSEETYRFLMKERSFRTGYMEPSASNFICRRRDYLDLGGCDWNFLGYGWEDYQQLFMLESHERGCNPLPGPLDSHNVTQRCRDEISRPKAKMLWQRNEWLCLLHHWHPKSAICPAKIASNRKILLEYIANYDTRRSLDH